MLKLGAGGPHFRPPAARPGWAARNPRRLARYKSPELSMSAQEEPYLAAAASAQSLVDIYLISGIRLTGHIDRFDRLVIWLRSPQTTQCIFKTAISTIQPSGGARPPRTERPAGATTGRRMPPKPRPS
jgi:host factor-I protein